jgi:hypothetical protein
MKYEFGENQIAYFDYQPPERMTRDYPGCDEQADIYSVTSYGIEVMHGIDEDDLRDLELRCLEQVHGTYEAKAAAREDYEFDQRRAG